MSEKVKLTPIKLTRIRAGYYETDNYWALNKSLVTGAWIAFYAKPHHLRHYAFMPKVVSIQFRYFREAKKWLERNSK